MDSNQAALRPGRSKDGRTAKGCGVEPAASAISYIRTRPSPAKSLPDAEITLITLPMLAELADRCPYIDRMLTFQGSA